MGVRGADGRRRDGGLARKSLDRVGQAEARAAAALLANIRGATLGSRHKQLVGFVQAADAWHADAHGVDNLDTRAHAVTPPSDPYGLPHPHGTWPTLHTHESRRP